MQKELNDILLTEYESRKNKLSEQLSLIENELTDKKKLIDSKKEKDILILKEELNDLKAVLDNKLYLVEFEDGGKIRCTEEEMILCSNDDKDTKKNIDVFENCVKYTKSAPITSIAKLASAFDESAGNFKYEIEANFLGQNISISKIKKYIKITDLDNKEDITRKYIELTSQLSNLADSDFLLLGELLEDEDDIKIYIKDILYLDDDLFDLPWNERYAKLKKLNFSANIKEIPGIVVDNKADFQKAVKLFCWLPRSKGAVIKNYFLKNDYYSYELKG